MPMGHNAVSNPDTLDSVAKLFKQGLSDVEIAKRLKLHKNTVVLCRLKRGLRKQRRVR